MRRHTVLFPFTAIVAFVLTGCTSSAEPPEGVQSPGSWSEEMRQEYEKANLPEVEEALRDGTISDQEYSEMTQRYTACLAAAGISVTKYGIDGAVMVPPSSLTSDDAHNVERECSDQFGEYPIAYFYVQMRANPSHKDMAQSVVDCFKRRGLVGPSYGLKDYQAGDLPSSDQQAATMSRPPEDLTAAPRVSEIAVGRDHFDDARPVQLAVTGVAPTHLFAPVSGKVTAFSCAHGATVSSGGTPLSLDGTPKLALATGIPLWRDLSLETRGDDVRAFQDELSRLGFSLTTDGVMGRNTLEAAKTAFARIGVTQESDVVSVGSLVWIPEATATISACDASVGADVQQGAALASFVSRSANVSIVDLPTGLLPGARLVIAGDSPFPVDSDGHVPVADANAFEVTATPDSSGSNAKPIEAQLVLAEPIAVSVVPPNAVYNVNGTDGCVTSHGVRYRVHIFGSQLGETLVTFAKGQAPTHVDTPAKRHASCA